ncbi:oligosaccharide flippase family protein [Thalassomonas haliotis]|uniref:Oligosaccharide flippase family protein n=1 Tax=Thalassomonas haliotis TaxID=485448 RepID=A0ABY7VK33_9GAMM|nr:oligosaccharide flippase family protein [Thalassomonas haliotis]WDE13283.1 oligosaccharide flippase family protein [Thalassomonas haliotis]
MLSAKVNLFFTKLTQDEVFWGSFVALFVKVLASGLAFLVNVLAARYLGINEFGLFSMALSVMAVGVVIGKFGMEQSIVKFIVKARHSDDGVNESQVISLSLLLTLAISSVVAVIIFFAADILADDVFGKTQLKKVLLFAAVTIIPMAILNIAAQIFRANKNMLLNTLFSGAVSAFITLILLFFIRPKTASEYYLLMCIAVCASMCLCLLSAKCMYKISFGYKKPSGLNLMSASYPIFIASFVTLLNQHFGLLLLGRVSSAAEVGLYAVAMKIITLFIMITATVCSVTGSSFAHAFYQKNIAKLPGLAKKSSFLSAALTLPLLLVVMCFPQALLAIFGQEFIAADFILVVLLLGLIFNIFLSPCGHLLMMTGNEKKHRSNVLVAGGVNIALLLLLTEKYDALGVATAFSFSVMLQNILAMYSVKKELGFWVYPKLPKLSK